MQMKNPDVLAIPPVNAWLVMADNASEPTQHELNQRFSKRTPAGRWTGPPQARVGDLLFFYFMSPLKVIRYAARVASNPYFDSETEVNALQKVGKHQWWVDHTPLVPVPEVSFQELKAMHGGHLILRGRPRTYLSPEVVRQIQARMITRVEPSSVREFESVVQVPLGDPNLPTPATMTQAEWSAMADGAFALESKVEEHVVDPLLRFALSKDESITAQRQFPVKRKRADWAVVRSGTPVAVVETKLGVAEPRGEKGWGDSPEFAQLRHYMDVLDVPGLLIDARRVMLVAPGANSPLKIVDRRTATDADFVAIGQHLGVKQ